MKHHQDCQAKPAKTNTIFGILTSPRTSNSDEMPRIKELQDELGRLILERQQLARRVEQLEDFEDDEMLVIEQQRIQEMEEELATAIWKLQQMEAMVKKKNMVRFSISSAVDTSWQRATNEDLLN